MGLVRRRRRAVMSGVGLAGARKQGREGEGDDGEMVWMGKKQYLYRG